MGKMKIGTYCYLTADFFFSVFTEMFPESFFYQTYLLFFIYNLLIWLITTATNR